MLALITNSIAGFSKSAKVQLIGVLQARASCPGVDSFSLQVEYAVAVAAPSAFGPL